MTINDGDVVQLKSGGPKMTVTGDTLGAPICKWFDGTTLKEGVFSNASLNVVNP